MPKEHDQQGIRCKKCDDLIGVVTGKFTILPPTPIAEYEQKNNHIIIHFNCKKCDWTTGIVIEV